MKLILQYEMLKKIIVINIWALCIIFLYRLRIIPKREKKVDTLTYGKKVMGL